MQTDPVQTDPAIPGRRTHRQRGATLVETMVALFILGVGLLGTLSMQVKAVNSNQRAQFATDANILALDMASRIQAYERNLAIDQLGVIKGDYSIDSTASSSATEPTCLATGCTAEQQRAFDEWQWLGEIKKRLPDGIGQVAYLNGVYTITVMWNNDQTPVPTANCSGSGTDRTCFVYKFKLANFQPE